MELSKEDKAQLRLSFIFACGAVLFAFAANGYVMKFTMFTLSVILIILSIGTSKRFGLFRMFSKDFWTSERNHSLTLKLFSIFILLTIAFFATQIAALELAAGVEI